MRERRACVKSGINITAIKDVYSTSLQAFNPKMEAFSEMWRLFMLAAVSLFVTVG